MIAKPIQVYTITFNAHIFLTQQILAESLQHCGKKRKAQKQRGIGVA